MYASTAVGQFNIARSSDRLTYILKKNVKIPDFEEAAFQVNYLMHIFSLTSSAYNSGRFVEFDFAKTMFLCNFASGHNSTSS